MLKVKVIILYGMKQKNFGLNNMPELPEVETIKRQLSRKIKGKKIKSVKVNLPKLVKYPLKKFKDLVKGVKINKISRRAKLLIIELSNNYCLVIHLKLSGQLIFNGQISKHSHIVYYFTNKDILVHNDVRQFGFIKIVPKDELNSFFKKERFGPEPLSNKFNLELFKELLLKRKNSKIKILLMDQKFIAGVGNIYSDEVLFFAKILPSRITGIDFSCISEGFSNPLSFIIFKRGLSFPNSFSNSSIGIVP